MPCFQFSDLQPRVATVTGAVALLLLSTLAGAAQQSRSLYVNDDSDWWSRLNLQYRRPEAPLQQPVPTASNLRILGVELGEDQIEKAEIKLGRGQPIDRGDASTGRSQLCYVSAADAGDIHLIFEQGEIEFFLYLFVGGPKWNGNERCVKSSDVSMHLSTASGLHLGQTPSEVEKILGKPGARLQNKFFYAFELTRKSPTKPYKVSGTIEVRFENSKSSYLAIGIEEIG